MAAAKAEGNLVIYGSPSLEALKSDSDGFQKRYGIKSTYTRLLTGPLVSRVDAEVSAGGIHADIVLAADEGKLQEWSGKGLFAKLPEGTAAKTTDYYAPAQVSGASLGYNTDLIPKDAPQTWADVLDPKWTGKVVLGSPRIGAAYSSVYYALLHDPKYGRAYFDKLATLKPRVLETDVLVSQTVVSGEAALGFPQSRYNVASLKQQSASAPIAYDLLDIASNVYTWVNVVQKAEHPNAAALFALWIMSPEGQIAHNGSGRAASILGELPGTLPPNPADRVPKQTTIDVGKELPAIIDMFDKLYK